MNNYPTCKTCKFFKVETHTSSSGYTSHRIKCSSEKFSDDYNQPKEESKDMLLYSYQENGKFYPGPDFGCIHHTEKEGK